MFEAALFSVDSQSRHAEQQTDSEFVCVSKKCKATFTKHQRMHACMYMYVVGAHTHSHSYTRTCMLTYSVLLDSCECGFAMYILGWVCVISFCLTGHSNFVFQFIIMFLCFVDFHMACCILMCLCMFVVCIHAVFVFTCCNLFQIKCFLHFRIDDIYIKIEEV